MMDVRFIGGAVIWFVSFSGLMLFLNLKLKVKSYLTPGLAACLFLVAEYCAGILNIMIPVTYALLISGCGCWVIILAERKKIFASSDSRLNFIPLCLILIIYIAGLIRFEGMALTNYDDFSHWGLIVKSMVFNNRLPVSQDSYIAFKSYPPGSACFIFSVVKVLGFNEGRVLFANYLLKVCLLSSLFSIYEIATTRLSKILAAVVSTTAVLVYSLYGSLFALGVDSLLACAGIFCVLTVYLNRESIIPNLWIFAISASACVLIKNSGIFFYAIGVIFVLAMVIRERKFTKSNLRWFIWLLIPALMIWIWQSHVSLVFPNGLNAKHSLSYEYEKKIFSKKSSEDLKDEFGIFIRCATSWTLNRSLLLWVGLILFTGILLGVNHSDKALRKKVLSYVIFFLLFSLVYQIGILWTYMFSMSHSEVLSNDGSNYSRYNSTFVLFLAAFALVYVFSVLQYIRVKALVALCTACTCCVLWFSVEDKTSFSILNSARISNSAARYEVKLQAEALLNAPRGDAEKTYAIRANTNKTVYSGYLKHLLRYLTLTNANSVYDHMEDEETWQEYWETEATEDYCIDLISMRLLKRKKR